MQITLAALLFAFSSIAVAAEPPASSGSASPLLSDCRLPDVPATARCGTFDVPENPDRPEGRRLSIHVAVLPAKKQPAKSDPIAYFSGGPGQSAIASAGDVGVGLAAMYEDRDILLIDQRGTGRSAPLTCALYDERDPAASLAHLFPPRAIERCLERLPRQADLTQYSFLRFADDVERVRRDLGYGRLNLHGLSYGTRAAQVYLRAYPDSVRTAYLGSVVPIDIATPLPFARAAEATLQATIEACERDAACAKAFPKLAEETNQVFAKLKTGRVTTIVPGVDTPVPLSAGRMAERLRAMMYSPQSAADVPWAIHRAAQGDWSPFVDGLLEAARAADSDISEGLFFSITCAEDVRFIPEADIAPAVRGTILGDFRVRDQQAACANWPKATLPAGYRDPVHSNVPTLFVSGEHDPATPYAFAEHVGAGFPNGVQLILLGQGHSGWNECAERAYRKLIESGSTAGIDTACVPTPRPPFKTAAK